jgi:hypothetical protein
MYTLQSNLSIVGNICGTQESQIPNFIMKPVINGVEKLTMADNESNTDEEGDWIPSHRNWKTDFTLLAEQILSNPSTIKPLDKQTISLLKKEILQQIESTEFKLETMYIT